MSLPRWGEKHTCCSREACKRLVKQVVNHIMIYFGVPPFFEGGIFFYTIYGLNLQMYQYLFVNLHPNIILKLITKKYCDYGRR